MVQVTPSLLLVSQSDLLKYAEKDLPTFMSTLSVELSSVEKPNQSQLLADIALSLLDGKDSVRKDHVVQQWVAMDETIKFQVKSSLLSALGSGIQGLNHTVALIIGKMASIEFSTREWSELVNSLFANMTHPDSPASLKEATLEALGYVCAEIKSSEGLKGQDLRALLQAVVQGMKVSERNSEVRLAAVRALNHAFGCIPTKFLNEEERMKILNGLYYSAVMRNKAIREATFDALGCLVNMWYDELEPHIQRIATITLDAIAGESEAVVAISAADVWFGICVTELGKQGSQVLQSGDPVPHLGFVKKFLPNLVEALLHTLSKQYGIWDDKVHHQDGIWKCKDLIQEDGICTRNVAMAGGKCLCFASMVVGDDIIPHVRPYVLKHLLNTDMRFKEAAMTAFGEILEGTSTEKLTPMLNSVLKVLLDTMKGKKGGLLKDTTAWTLCRIFQLCRLPEGTGFPQVITLNLYRILEVLLECTGDAPHVVLKVYRALHLLVEGYKETHLMRAILAKLIDTAANQTDCSNWKLYECIRQVVMSSNVEMSASIAEILPVIMSELQAAASTDHSNMKEHGKLKKYLCLVLAAIIDKLQYSDKLEVIQMVDNLTDKIMELLLKIFDSSTSDVRSGVMFSFAALGSEPYKGFGMNHMAVVCNNIKIGLESDEDEFHKATYRLVEKLYINMRPKVLPYCAQIMELLNNDFSGNYSKGSAKLRRRHIISRLTEIALAFEWEGRLFNKYASEAIRMIEEALEYSAQEDEEDEKMESENEEEMDPERDKEFANAEDLLYVLYEIFGREAMMIRCNDFAHCRDLLGAWVPITQGEETQGEET